MPRSFLFASLAAITVICATDTASAAQIRASYTMVYDRIRPDPQRGVNVTANFDVTLNESGGIAEQIKRNSGRVSDGFDNKMKLGGGWRVTAANQLQRTIDQPQSILVVTITTSGSACTVQPKWTLKSGFNEFKFKRITDQSWAFYSQPRVTSSTCSIR
jgi:hypothetical protein